MELDFILYFAPSLTLMATHLQHTPLCFSYSCGSLSAGGNLLGGWRPHFGGLHQARHHHVCPPTTKEIPQGHQCGWPHRSCSLKELQSTSLPAGRERPPLPSTRQWWDVSWTEAQVLGEGKKGGKWTPRRTWAGSYCDGGAGWGSWCHCSLPSMKSAGWSTTLQALAGEIPECGVHSQPHFSESKSCRT